MKTLLVQDGDLVVGGSGHAVVSGMPMVRQELGLAIREPYGSDRYHPSWGSLLGSYVGEPIGITTEALIRAEISRIVSNYVMTQHAIMQEDMIGGRRPRFSAGEAIDRIGSIEVVQRFDRFHIKVVLIPLSGNETVLTSTVGVSVA